MERKLNRTDMSDLEFELEMDEDEPATRESDLDEEPRAELEQSEPEEEFEEPDEGSTDFGRKFYELSLSRESYESEIEAGSAIEKPLLEMQQEYFLGGLVKKLKRAGKGLINRSALSGLTRFATGALNGGFLKPLATAALTASLGPLGPAAALALSHGPKILSTLKTLGLSPTPQAPAAALQAWGNYANLAQNAYRQLADNVNVDAVEEDPEQAAQAAAQAFNSALQEVGSQVTNDSTSRGTRVFYLSKGDRLVIKVK